MKTKKIALTTSLLLAITSPIVTIISCSSNKAKPGIYLALDGHDHTAQDKSFNEQSFIGIQEYLNYLNTEGMNTLKQNEPYVRPPSATNKTSFKALYASIPRGSTIVAPGYQQQDALLSATEELQDKKVIYLDGSINDISNIASVIFNVEEAAYLGGYALAKYASTIDGFDNLKNANGTDANDANKVQISAYIGSKITPVLGFINGLEYGIRDGLAAILSDKTNYPHADAVEFTYLNTKDDHLSGSYKSGDGITVTNKLKAAGVDVIMPVAGPQTADTLSVFTGKVIGVDTKQEDFYAKNSEQFIFSVMKDLTTATVNMLKKINGDSSISADYLGLGATTTGTISNNLVAISNTTDPITAIYNELKNDATIVARAQAIQPSVDWFLNWTSTWYNSI